MWVFKELLSPVLREVESVFLTISTNFRLATMTKITCVQSHQHFEYILFVYIWQQCIEINNIFPNYFDVEGSFINDITQFWTIFWPPPHIDTLSLSSSKSSQNPWPFLLKTLTSLMDDPWNKIRQQYHMPEMTRRWTLMQVLANLLNWKKQ